MWKPIKKWELFYCRVWRFIYSLHFSYLMLYIKYGVYVKLYFQMLRTFQLSHIQ